MASDVLVAIDPGVRKSAIAVFEGGLLTCVDWAHSSNTVAAVAVGGFTLVIEKPHAYPRSPVDANDLIDLAWEAAALATAFAPKTLRVVEPRVWKGQVPKPIHHRRLFDVLSLAEVSLFPPGIEDRIHAACAALSLGKKPKYSADVHNQLDAAALGCWALGRLK